MSDLLNKASLVMVPSGYKEDTIYSVVPSDGSGDLSFTRASNGTRINSAGLVEVCPWNLAQQSETFDNATWQKSGIAVTANSAANPLTGLTNADNLVAENVTNFHYIYQPITYTTDTYTIFVYLKANGYNWFVIDSGLSNKYSYFNLSTGVLGTAGSGATASIESVGNGWYKCGLTYAGVASSAGIYLSVRNADNGGSFTGNGTGGVLAYGAQLNIGSTAKPYFPTTDRLNVPRLTYQNGGGGCPSLLLEKQSTNYIPYSEDYTNAAWTKNGVSITANNTTSPDGTQNADKLTSNDPSGSVYRIYEVGITPSDSVCSVSCYFKYDNWQYAFITADNYSNVGRYAVFDLINATNTYVSSGYTATITSVGNGWYKCTITGEFGINAYCQFGLALTSTTYAGASIANGKNLYVWGTQREQSSYPTSYIPTTSSSATRVADECYKTGISSLIGQTEGVVFLDFIRNFKTSSYDRYLSVDDADGSNYRTGIYIIPEPSEDGKIYLTIRNNNVDIVAYSYVNSTNTRLKIAIAYKSGDIAYYANGVQVHTNSTALTFAHTLSKVYSAQNGQSINELVLFKTRLTNAELASLTTI